MNRFNSAFFSILKCDLCLQGKDDTLNIKSTRGSTLEKNKI